MRRAASDWITSINRDVANFNWICHQVGIEPAYLRRGLDLTSCTVNNPYSPFLSLSEHTSNWALDVLCRLAIISRPGFTACRRMPKCFSNLSPVGRAIAGVAGTQAKPPSELPLDCATPGAYSR
jgi:hypothetical protein